MEPQILNSILDPPLDLSGEGVRTSQLSIPLISDLGSRGMETILGGWMRNVRCSRHLANNAGDASRVKGRRPWAYLVSNLKCLCLSHHIRVDGPAGLEG